MFWNMDCILGARKHLADNSVDLIICDPPYGIKGDKLDKHYYRDESTVIDGYVEVPESEYAEFSRKWIQEAARILRPGGSLYIVSGWSNLCHIMNALNDTNLTELNHIIWKYNFGVYTSRKFVSSHYHILFYTKPGGTRTFNTFAFFSDSERTESGGAANYIDREDVWIINREYKPGEVKNKNQLPTALLTKMMMYSSKPDDLICDFFMGSFSTAKVAIGLGRRATGFEVNKKAFDYQMGELKKIRPGELLGMMRQPGENKLVNKGKPLDDAEKKMILDDFGEMTGKGMTKKSSIEKLTEKYGRGYWSIQRMIDAAEPKTEHLSLFSA